MVVLLTDTFVYMCYNTSGWKTLKIYVYIVISLTFLAPLFFS